MIDGASRHPGSLRLTVKGPHAASASETNERDQRGDVVAFSGSVSTAGARRLNVAAARSAATRFLAQRAPHLASAGLTVVSQRPATHGPGEELESFTYRSRVAGIPGPTIALLEVDLRSGEVVFEATGQVTPSSTRFVMTRGQAEAAALAATHGRGAVVSVEKDVWSIPRWTVTLKAPSGAIATVEINAADGRVAGISYADPSS